MAEQLPALHSEPHDCETDDNQTELIPILHYSLKIVHEIPVPFQTSDDIPKIDSAENSVNISTEQIEIELESLRSEVETCKHLLTILLNRFEQNISYLQHNSMLQSTARINLPASLQVTRDNYSSIRQGYSESVRDFDSRIQMAVSATRSLGIAHNDCNLLARNAFIDGLHANLRNRVKARNPETLSHAFVLAEKFEAENLEHQSNTVRVHAFTNFTSSFPHRPNANNRPQWDGRTVYPRDRSFSQGRRNQSSGPNQNWRAQNNGSGRGRSRSRKRYQN